MTDIVIRKKNEAYIKVDCDASISHELTEYFTFDVPGARFSPAFKARKWDGKLRIFSYMKREVYSGLAGHIEKFAKDRDYSFENTIAPNGANVTREQIESFIESLDYHAHGKKIELRDYQVESIYRCIHDDRLLLVSPTSSGKSAMIGGVVRWHQSHDRRCLIIVPTTSLVSQMYGDLNDYFSHSGWTSADNCHKIMGGADKNHDKPITISTWQSLFKMDKEYFDQFDCVMVDECFSGDTPVLTPFGYVQIQDIRPGDIVLNYDESDGIFKEDTVIKVHENLKKSEDNAMYLLEFDNGVEIKVTGNHMFLTDKGWVRADELTEDLEIINTDIITPSQGQLCLPEPDVAHYK